ncbi:G-patch domain/DExH-box splicing factor binding site [Novymonas esmeraldas]|uniref:PinX1-related protein 1 n=1 Tax=Novymonas esmeraldas TaxID=1808958 RepID=A0AAW0F577_9TRYP
MATDPNGNRWSTSANNFGKALLKKSGWTEGSGLGKEQDGVVSHVKVSRKDDVMGLGYQAGVHETWTTQSVGFADVLTRIRDATAAAISDSDDDGAPHSLTSSSPTTAGEPRRVGVSRHYKMYAKRNALKTELVHGSGSAATEALRIEILGGAATKRPRDGLDDGDRAAGAHRRGRHESASTLASPLLSRLMVRCAAEEPKPTADDTTPEERIAITKPHPRPPKCTDTPFLA